MGDYFRRKLVDAVKRGDRLKFVGDNINWRELQENGQKIVMQHAFGTIVLVTVSQVLNLIV